MVQAVRMVADALASGTYGVNVQIDSLTLDGSDSAPPDIVDVLNPVDDDIAAKGDAGPDWPVLVVVPSAPVEWEGEVGQTHRDADSLTIGIGYVTRDADSAEGYRNTQYTLEAVSKTLKTFNSEAKVADRTRGGICLWICRRLVWDAIPPQQLPGGLVISGALFAEYKTRDSAP